jgi:hypothetical protein
LAWRGVGDSSRNSVLRYLSDRIPLKTGQGRIEEEFSL